MSPVLARVRRLYSPFPRRLGTGLLVALGVAGAGEAAQLRLTWSPVHDPRVALYQVHYWSGSPAKSLVVDAVGTSALVVGLRNNADYFFAVRACELRAVTCSEFSSVVCASVPAAPGLAVRECPASVEDMLEALPGRGGWRSTLW